MKRTVGIFVGGRCGRDDARDLCAVMKELAGPAGLAARKVESGDLSEGLSGVVLIDATALEVRSWSNLLSTIEVRTCESIRAATTVHFSDQLSVPQFFRGRALRTEAAVPNASEVAKMGEPLARSEAGPLWCSAFKSGVRHDVCWVRRPWVGPQDCLFDHLNGRRFMSLLPVFDWMRYVSGWTLWQHPPLRACFIFDDPNLHSSQFGFLSFRKLVEEGTAHRYHTSLATIPLDAYFESANTVKLFQEHREVLSLCVHGNNHTYRELAQPESQDVKVALMGQALRRIELMEKRTGLSVSRVMVPPHEACSAETMAALVAAGFEAASLSYGSIRAFNRGAEWVMGLGASPAINHNGLQIMPRFPFVGSPENSILLAAYLGQPILPLGHHWDVRDGLACLARQAAFINGLGDVHWMDMQRIARSSYQWRVDGEVMWVQTSARRIELSIPSGIEEVRVLTPWIEDDSAWVCTFGVGESIQCLPLQRADGFWTIPSPPHGPVALSLARQEPRAISAYVPPRLAMRALARRLLVELRDRSMPFLPRRFVRR